MATNDRRGRGRGNISRRLVLWLVGSATGVLLLALPDDDDRVFSISDTHGPSVVDLLGMVIAIGAWGPIAASMWFGRSVLATAERRLVSAVVVAAVVALAATVKLDLGHWWVVPVVLLVIAQSFVLYELRRRA